MMATDVILLERIRTALLAQSVEWREIQMFGGHCFMVDEKMCLGTYKGGLMARVGPDAAEKYVEHTGAAQMIHGGRPMKGYLLVEPDGFEDDADLKFWIETCLAFNPQARSSKKKA